MRQYGNYCLKGKLPQYCSLKRETAAILQSCNLASCIAAVSLPNSLALITMLKSQWFFMVSTDVKDTNELNDLAFANLRCR